MMKIFQSLIFSSILISLTFGANVYVRDGGSGSGTSWSDALDNLPATLTRGNTYYVADGSYGSYDFDDNESGTTYITVKKATASDHGTETGWSSTYGDGQATWTFWRIENGYYILDGATRSGWRSGHGFKVTSSGKCIKFENTGAETNVTIKYTEIEGAGNDGDGPGNDGIYAIYGFSYLTLQYNYFHDHGRVHILSYSSRNWLVEYNWFEKNESVPGEHSEPWAIHGGQDNIVRFNVFHDFEGTGCLVTLDTPTGTSDWDIYGNVFVITKTVNSDARASNGVITTDSESRWNNINIYNNAFINIDDGANAGVSPANSSGVIVKNNIWYDCDSPGLSLGNTEDYNWYFSNGSNDGNFQGANDVQGSDNPFINWQGFDFRLDSTASGTLPIDNGVDLGSPYDSDPDGNTRGADGLWDIGAYESEAGGGGGGETDTTPPTAVIVLSKPSSDSVKYAISEISSDLNTGNVFYDDERDPDSNPFTIIKILKNNADWDTTILAVPNSYNYFDTNLSDDSSNVSNYSDSIFVDPASNTFHTAQKILYEEL